MTETPISTGEMDRWLWSLENSDRPNEGEMIDAIRARLSDYDLLDAEVCELKERYDLSLDERRNLGEERDALRVEVERLKKEKHDRIYLPKGYVDEGDFYDKGEEPDWKSRAEKAEAELARLQNIIDCANTPLMADVLKERDELKAALKESNDAMTTISDVAALWAERAEKAEAELAAANYRYDELQKLRTEDLAALAERAGEERKREAVQGDPGWHPAEPVKDAETWFDDICEFVGMDSEEDLRFQFAIRALLSRPEKENP